MHEPNREASKIPYRLLTIIALPLICLKRVFFKLNEAELTTSEHQTTDISPYEEPLSIKGVQSMLLNLSFNILEAKTVWFFGILPLPLTFPRYLSKFYYMLTNYIDELFERIGLYRNIAGAVFIIAQKTESED